MNLVLQREVLSDKSTIGKLSINDEFFCWTLEDRVRPAVEKVYGMTAIPTGRYQVKIDFSNHFQKRLPHILDVPNFTGIRIHSGNDAASTDCCILIGLTKFTDFISKSREAMAMFLPKLEAALQDGQEVWIEVRNPDTHQVANA